MFLTLHLNHTSSRPQMDNVLVFTLGGAMEGEIGVPRDLNGRALRQLIALVSQVREEYVHLWSDNRRVLDHELLEFYSRFNPTMQVRFLRPTPRNLSVAVLPIWEYGSAPESHVGPALLMCRRLPTWLEEVIRTGLLGPISQPQWTYSVAQWSHLTRHATPVYISQSSVESEWRAGSGDFFGLHSLAEDSAEDAG